MEFSIDEYENCVVSQESCFSYFASIIEMFYEFNETFNRHVEKRMIENGV